MLIDSGPAGYKAERLSNTAIDSFEEILKVNFRSIKGFQTIIVLRA
jgi:hypothetical protein